MGRILTEILFNKRFKTSINGDLKPVTLISNKLIIYFSAFCLIEVFFILFFPANRTEIDDGYWYAADIRDTAYLDLFNPRFFLFLPVMKLLYDATLAIGLSIDPYLFMCIASMITSGLVLILLYDTLIEYLEFDKRTAVVIVVLTAISYEYWRYSVEAELYIISIFLVIIALRLFLKYRNEHSYGHIFWLGIFGAFATLFYKPNFIPLYIVFPILFLYQKKFTHLAIYYVVSALLIISSFYIVFEFGSTTEPFLGYLFGGLNQPVGSPVASAFVIASNIISVLWIFSFDPAVEFIITNFPHKVIEEEVFLAQQVGDLKYVLLVVLLAIGALGSLLLLNAIRRRSKFTKERFKILMIIALWLIVYSGFLAVMDPTSNEPWLMIQVPLFVLFGALLIEPLLKKQMWMAYTFLFLIFINNALGGFYLLMNKDYDYYQQKGAWLTNNATGEDYIVTYGPVSFIRYLRFHTNSTVLNLEENPASVFELFQNPTAVSGEIYFPENLFHPPRAIKYRSSIDLDKMSALFEKQQFQINTVSEGEEAEFNTYQLNN